MIHKATACQIAFGEDPRAERWTAARLERFKRAGLLPTDTCIDLIRWVSFAARSDTISTVIGANGLGKSSAAQLYADERPDEVVYLETEPASSYSNAAMVADLASLYGVNATRTIDRRRQLAHALRHDGRLLIIDTEDTLHAEHLMTLRWLHLPHPSRSEPVEGHAPIMVVGAPQLDAVLNRCPAFATRVGYARRVYPMDRAEVTKWFAAGGYSEPVGMAAYQATHGVMVDVLHLACHIEADRKAKSKRKERYTLDDLRQVVAFDVRGLKRATPAEVATILDDTTDRRPALALA